ncbi:hypothetical protein G6F40_016409 [Rhizopus arrhizus]|nr:hypothetical protein G6F40_016409 [Rhizopus arrhizus]
MAPAASYASCTSKACPTAIRCAPKSPPASSSWTKATPHRSRVKWAAPVTIPPRCRLTPPASPRNAKAKTRSGNWNWTRPPAGRQRRHRARRRAGPAARNPSALRAPGQRGLHASGGPPQHPPARV